MNLPTDLDAERTVLSAAFVDSDTASLVADGLEADCFTTHRETFAAVVRLLGRAAPTDAIAVKGELEAAGVSNAGQLVMDVMDVFGIPATVGFYVNRLRACYRRRQIIMAGIRLAQLGERSDLDPDQVDAAAEQILDVLAPRDVLTATARPASELARSYLDWLESGRSNSSIPTGFADLDSLTNGGLRPGQLVIVAARPGIGKSILLLNFARHAAVTQGRPVLFASMEMGRNEVMARLFAQVSRLPLEKLSVPNGIPAELAAALQDTAQKIAKADHLIIEDDTYFGVHNLRARLSAMRRAGHPAELVCVDYLQLMEAASGKSENRQQEVSTISRDLKRIAAEFDVPVVVACQLNRGPESRADKKPTKADLRESGSLEQDADIVILIHRPDAYEPESARAGEVDLIVDKHRQGPKAVITAASQPHYARFVDMAPPAGGWGEPQ